MLPWPCALATVMSPPIMRASRRESARPSPVPPKRRDTLASAWPKLSKSRAICSGVMPIPVSVTAKVSQSPPGPAARSTASVTVPASVNLHALLRRLNSAWRTFVRSACMPPASGPHRTSIRFRFFSARGWMTAAMSRTSAGTSKSSR